jgi:hypothetical protein
MWLPPSSFLHTGHTPLSVFPLIPFTLQTPIFHLPIPFLSSNMQIFFTPPPGGLGVVRGPVEWHWQGKPDKLGKKVSFPLCPQFPHLLILARTRDSAMRGRRLTTWAMTSLRTTNDVVLTPDYMSHFSNFDLAGWYPWLLQAAEAWFAIYFLPATKEVSAGRTTFLTAN